MRNPNGYGSIIKLSGKRRNPYAVRITDGIVSDPNGNYQQKYKYLGYFPDRKSASIFLAQYHSNELSNLISASKKTFSQVFEEWVEYKISLKHPPAGSTIRNYEIAYRNMKELHSIRFQSIRVNDIEKTMKKFSDHSKSTVYAMKTVLSQMYQYAMRMEYVEKDYSALAAYEWETSQKKSHRPFTEEEIEFLWENIDKKHVDLILIMIYTGFRVSGFLQLKNNDVHLKERYIVGGVKTSAGKNRIVPIHKRIEPLVQNRWSSQPYFIKNYRGTKYTYTGFRNYVWAPCMKMLGFEHSIHDTRHTLATLLNRYGANDVATKRILGHSISDITKGIYTHKNIDDLVDAIDHIPMIFSKTNL